MKKIFYILILFLIVFSSHDIFAVTASTTADQLKVQIEDRNAQIQQLEAEINQYNGQLNVVSGQSKTLQGTIKTLDLTAKKIGTDLTLTNKKISKTELTLEQILGQISDTQSNIDTN